MNAKPRPKIPTWVRRRESARRWFSSLRRDVQELRDERSDRPGKPGSKPRSGGPAVSRSNPWPRCASCHRRRPASEYECDEPEHAELCNGCCGCSSGGRGGGGGGCSCSGRCDCKERDDERDEDEGDEPAEQEPGQREDGEDEQR